MLSSYQALAKETTIQTVNYGKVYDAAAKSKIYNLYIKPAKDLSAKLQTAVNVKKAINSANTLIIQKATSDKIAPFYKTAMVHKSEISQSNFKDQLKTAVAPISDVSSKRLNHFFQYVVI
ncbi:hypothetical protein ACM6Q7_04165 [Peribacillus butanolivorans]|uniref:hypothetical protein n=1 Tax=Peribacillus butanolivorans TaxID=421767 RepID=UPI0039FC3DC1